MVELTSEEIEKRCAEKKLADIAAAEAEEQRIIADKAAREAASEQAKWDAYNLEQIQRAKYSSGEPVPRTLKEAGLA